MQYLDNSFGCLEHNNILNGFPDSQYVTIYKRMCSDENEFHKQDGIQGSGYI